MGRAVHEMALAQSVVQIVEEHARRAGCARVKTVRLEIGQLAGVEPEALGFCFDAAARDGIAAGARLEIVELPGRARCAACGATAAVATRTEPCPDCGGYELQPTGGTELRVKELEVE